MYKGKSHTHSCCCGCCWSGCCLCLMLLPILRLPSTSASAGWSKACFLRNNKYDVVTSTSLRTKFQEFVIIVSLFGQGTHLPRKSTYDQRQYPLNQTTTKSTDRVKIIHNVIEKSVPGPEVAQYRELPMAKMVRWKRISPRSSFSRERCVVTKHKLPEFDCNYEKKKNEQAYHHSQTGTQKHWWCCEQGEIPNYPIQCLHERQIIGVTPGKENQNKMATWHTSKLTAPNMYKKKKSAVLPRKEFSSNRVLCRTLCR